MNVDCHSASLAVCCRLGEVFTPDTDAASAGDGSDAPSGTETYPPPDLWRFLKGYYLPPSSMPRRSSAFSLSLSIGPVARS